MTTHYDKSPRRSFAYAEALGSMTAVAMMAAERLGTHDRERFDAEIERIEKVLSAKIDAIQAEPVTR